MSKTTTSNATTGSVLTGANPFGAEPADDLLHEPLHEVPLWSETHFFTVWNPAENVGVWIHVGTHWEDPGIWHGQVFAYLPGGEEVVGDISWGRPIDDRGPQTGAFRASCVEPLKRWKLTYDGVGERTTIERAGSDLFGGGPAFTPSASRSSSTPRCRSTTCLRPPDWRGATGLASITSRRCEAAGRLRSTASASGASTAVRFAITRSAPATSAHSGAITSWACYFPRAAAQSRRLIMWSRENRIDLRAASINDGAELELIADVEMTGLEHDTSDPAGLHDTVANPRKLELMLGRADGERLTLPVEILHTAPQTYFDPNIFCNGCAVGAVDENPMFSAQCAVAVTWTDGERGYGNLERTYRRSQLTGLK